MSKSNAVTQIQRMTTILDVTTSYSIKCIKCEEPHSDTITGGALDLSISRELFTSGWRYIDGVGVICPTHMKLRKS